MDKDIKIKRKREFEEVNCPICGKKRTIELNIPFFGDQRMCPEHCQGSSYSLIAEDSNDQ